MVRQGQPSLLLLFPDGSRRFVPVTWTDAAPDPVTAPSRKTLAPLHDLLRARAIIDDLLQRLPAAQENPDAPPADTSTATSSAAAAVPRRPRPQPRDLGTARPRQPAGRTERAGSHPGRRSRRPKPDGGSP